LNGHAVVRGAPVIQERNDPMGEIRLRVAVLVFVVGCVEVDQAEVEQSVQPEPVSIDARRSLAVTDQAILARFPFERVMNQLVDQLDTPGLTALGLFQQWWGTQNPPQCTGSVNGFPYQCRPAPSEGIQATQDPFASPDTNPAAYLPIGLFNRFDLTPSDASSCGEYRIVYARRSGLTDTRARNLIIFEFALATPHPQQGLKGCRKIVDLWADLTAMDDVEERADELETFYFDGIPSVPPVVHVQHLGGGATGLGQVRTNQFMAEGMDPRVWSLREFHLIGTQMVPVSVKGNPFGPLFSPFTVVPQTIAFQAAFLDQVPALAATTFDKIDIVVPDTFNAAQSQASGTTENNYALQLGTDASTFRTAIAARLTAIGSTLTPDEIALRAQQLSCAGCHRLNQAVSLGLGIISPSSLGFVHVSERDTEVVDGQTRFRISDALIQQFLPKREQVMEDYLNETLVKPPKPKDPLGGRRVH
jgi:hypothetical protein